MSVVAWRHQELYVLEVVVLADAPDRELLSNFVPIKAVQATLLICHDRVERPLRVYVGLRKVFHVFFGAQMMVKNFLEVFAIFAP